jgi:hypothetical protein
MAPEAPEPQEYRPPPHQLAIWSVIGLAVLGVIGLISLRLDHRPDTSREYPSRALIPDAQPVLLPPPPMNDEYDPCSDCHEDEIPNPERRQLEDEHDLMKLAHGELWCLHCHDLHTREKLRLADSSLIGFEESWRLCTQCHGKKLADWRAGVHGKRMGSWRGSKEYWNCVACHDPHEPAFKSLEPEPPPLRPVQISLDGNVVEEVVHEAP